MYPIDLSSKVAAIFGVANHRSLAWGVAQALHQAGARLLFTYQGERFKDKVAKLAGQCNDSLLVPCDVTDDASVQNVFQVLKDESGQLDMMVHSVAYAPRAELENPFLDTSRAGYRLTMEISAYSLVNLAAAARPLMEVAGGGQIVTMSFMASEKVIPRYNVMGSAKAALEHAVRQLAYELGPRNIRINALSAGPLNTLAARGISGIKDMLAIHREQAPMKRNITLEEVGRSALYLLSDLSSGVTGETLHVDAGYNIMGM
ncbi:MAG: enoyl-ACP reductase [Acidobacteria bacterium]|nr:enoyl-ACP reductase [Acidobacteriota bacterium]